MRVKTTHIFLLVSRIICTQMGEMIDLFLLALIAGFITVVYLFRSKQKKNLPPSPVGFPVIGHLHLLKEPVHRSLRDLSRNLGSDGFFLRLGSRRAVVATSASAAEEFLSHENDVIFANRPLATLTEYMGYNCTIVSAAPYGEHWRRLRRFCAVDIFSAACLRDSSDIRRDEVRALLRKIHVELVTSGGNDFVRLKLQPLLYGLTFNILMSIVAGKREEDDETKEVRELIRQAFEFAGVCYVGDFLPILKLFDLDGYLKTAKKLTSKLDKLMQRLVDEHRRNRGKTELEKTMITHLLSLQESEPEHYTDDIIKGLVQVRARIFNSYDIESLIGRINIDIIKGFIQVMLLAGTDTTAVTLEWAISYG